MAPGLTSPGGILPDVKHETVLAIQGEGKENAIAIGITKNNSNNM